MAPDDQVSDRVLTVPNLISAARLAMIPILLWRFMTADTRGEFIAAFTLMAIIGASDWVDGFAARRLGQVSELGKLLDPVADRVAIIAVMAAFVLRDDGLVPLWVAAAIVGRDVLVAVVFAILESRGYPRIAVNRTGKAATACIFAGMALVAAGLILDPDPGMLARKAGVAVLGAGAFLYWAAGALYVGTIRRMLAMTKGA